MESLKKRKIMMVCQETYSFPMHFLAKKWANENLVGAFFINYCDSKYSINPANCLTYYKFPNHANIKLYNSNSAADDYTRIVNNDKIVDKEYLDVVEKKYTHFLPINEQLVTSQTTTRHYHYRNYYRLMSYTQQLNWLILNYKNIEYVVNDFTPDLVVDSNSDTMWRSILREVCYYMRIPYISLSYPRYETYLLPTFTLGYKLDDFFRQCYERNSQLEAGQLAQQLHYVREFKLRVGVMSSIYKNDVTAQYKPDSLWKCFKLQVRVVLYLFKQSLSGDNFAIKRSNPYLYPSDKEYVLFFLRTTYLKQRLLRHNKYFEKPDANDKYVYMPLHLIPESTTFSLAPLYVNELTIIEAVAKTLPAGWVLYVKEHQAMVGERSVDFYKKVSRIPNVKMVQLNYYSDPKPWIINSQGVITISGTTAYEAALLGKRALVFSDVPFGLIDGISRVRSFEDLPSLISDFKKPLMNEKSCAAYLKTVEECGEEINMKYILRHSADYIREGKEPDGELKKYIDNLERLFVKAFKMYAR